MSLANYTALQAAIASELNRSDLTSIIPDLITAAEAEITSSLRVRQMICRSQGPIDSEYMLLNDNFCGVKAIGLLTSPFTPLEFREADDIREMKASATRSGKPQFYSIIGPEIQFYPSPDATYTCELVLFETIPALATAASGTNWLLSRYPHVYKYGALKQSAPFLRDDERLGMWIGLYEDALEKIRWADAMEHYGSRPAMRTKGFG